MSQVALKGLFKPGWMARLLSGGGSGPAIDRHPLTAALTQVKESGGSDAAQVFLRAGGNQQQRFLGSERGGVEKRVISGKIR